MIPRFSYGFRSRGGTAPEQISRALHAVWERNNQQLRPADVVEEARSPDSVLHPEFTWSDVEAAEAWRLCEARRLIKCVVLVDEHANEINEWVHVAVKHESPRNYFYQEVLTVVQRGHTDELRAAMGELFTKMTSLALAYGRLRDFAQRANPQAPEIERIGLILEGLAQTRGLAGPPI